MALLAWRSPPRSRRWRIVWPEEAGFGAVPLQRANAASPLRRRGSLASSLAGELGLVGVGLGGKLAGAAGVITQHTEDELLRLRRPAPSAHPAHAGGQPLAVAGADPLAQRERCAGVQRLQLVEHPRALCHAGAVGHQQRPERLAAAAGTGRGEAIAGEDLLGRRQRVDLVGLAAPAVLTAGTFDLDDTDALREQELAETGAVAAGAFDPDDDVVAEPAQPIRKFQVAGQVGLDLKAAQQLPALVERSAQVLVLVGVHAHCDHPSPPHRRQPVMWRPPDSAVSSDVRLL